MVENKTPNNILTISNIALEQILSFEVILSESELKPQFQVILCKHLLFSEPELLGFPLKPADKSFVVCISKKSFSTKRIQNRLEKKKLKIERIKQASPETFLNCLCFTIFARFSPQYNCVGDYFVDGENFLWSESRLFAFTAEFSIIPNKVNIILKTYRISLPVLQLDQLNIANNRLVVYQNNKLIDYISQEHIGNRWCYVLPSLKKGCIVSIHKRFPTNNCFANYQALKLFWKNVHGYKLPESEKSIFFVNLSFGFSKNSFLYPSCCIRFHEPIIFQRVNFPVIENFCNLLREQFSSICDLKVSYNLSKSILDSTLALGSEHQKNIEFNKREVNVERKTIKFEKVDRKFNKVVDLNSSFILSTAKKPDFQLSKAINPINNTCSIKTIKDNDIPDNFKDQMVAKKERIVPKFNKIKPKLFKSDIPDDSKKIKNKKTNENVSNIRNSEFSDKTLNISIKKVVPSFDNSKKPLEANLKHKIADKITPLFEKSLNNSSVIKPTISSNKIQLESKTIVPVKRENDNKIKEPKEKKRKEVLIPDNIEDLISRNASLNKDVLMAWLKEKGVKCKAKDKKEELISKAQTFISNK